MINLGEYSGMANHSHGSDPPDWGDRQWTATASTLTQTPVASMAETVTPNIH
jgi:hypothetical protein